MAKQKSPKKNQRYFLVTFGCQMNVSDSERIVGALERRGYLPSSSLEKADLIVVNMCSIRKTAVDRAYGVLNKINQLKEEGRSIEAILTGCFLHATEQRKLMNGFDSVCQREEFFDKKNYLSSEPRYYSPYRAYVPIMTGCNNYCAYCVVPYTRGREYSRPAKEILNEVKNLIEQNYQEIWLLGQNVNSYQGEYGNRKINFAELLTQVNDLPGNFWLYFTTSHPKDLSDELIETMARSEKLAPYLNLPVQSGDNTILKKMNRPYTIRDYKTKVRKLRRAFHKFRPEQEKKLSLSTDIIVGFPGETEKRFQRTVRLMEEMEFDMAYIACYSPRPMTSAWNFADEIKEKEKKKRERILVDALKKTALKNNQFYLQRSVPVLINQFDKNKKCLFGKTRSHKNVKIKNGNSDTVGKIILVKITKAGPWGLEGEMERPALKP